MVVQYLPSKCHYFFSVLSCCHVPSENQSALTALRLRLTFSFSWSELTRPRGNPPEKELPENASRPPAAWRNSAAMVPVPWFWERYATVGRPPNRKLALRNLLIHMLPITMLSVRKLSVHMLSTCFQISAVMALKEACEAYVPVRSVRSPPVEPGFQTSYVQWL